MTDWAAQLFKMGLEKGLYCCYVSNGYMTLEARAREHGPPPPQAPMA